MGPGYKKPKTPVQCEDNPEGRGVWVYMDKTFNYCPLPQGVEGTRYLSDDHNDALFPEDDENFTDVAQVNGGHYENTEEQPVHQSTHQSSRQEDTGLDQVFETIEDVVLASQGLEQVSAKIEELVQLANSDQRTTVSFTMAQADAIRNAFACIICTNPVNEPWVSTCCNSIIGCRRCTEESMRRSTSCPKCRAEDFSPHRLTGLSDALAALGNLLRGGN